VSVDGVEFSGLHGSQDATKGSCGFSLDLGRGLSSRHATSIVAR
jgi:hypothetical protein